MTATENRSDRPIVSVNSHTFTYPPIDGPTRSPLDRIPARAAATAVVALGVLVLATGLSIRAVGAQGSAPSDDARLKSVQFDLQPAETNTADPLSAAGAANEARYRSLVVTDHGAEVQLEPLMGLVEVTLTGEHAAAMTAEVNGLQIGHGTDDFGNSLADAVSSNSAHRFAPIGRRPGRGSGVDQGVLRSNPERRGLSAGPGGRRQPLTGREHDDPPNEEKIPLPIAWTKTWTGSKGDSARVFHITMGSARDYESAGLRRMTINAAYWCMGLEDRVTATRSVDYVGPYTPLESGFAYPELNVIPRPVSYYR